jgi:excisionase family DNA binding protein
VDGKLVLDPNRLAVTLTVAELRHLVAATIQEANANPPPEKLLFTLSEAAKMSNVKVYRLADWCKAGAMPFRRVGRKYYFNQEDLNAIMEISEVKKQEES